MGRGAWQRSPRLHGFLGWSKSRQGARLSSLRGDEALFVPSEPGK